MMPITLFEKFSSSTFISSIKVIYLTVHTNKSYKLRNTNIKSDMTWNIAIQNGKKYYTLQYILKSKSSRLSTVLEESKLLEIREGNKKYVYQFNKFLMA